MSDIDFRDDESDSPLHWAVLLDNLPMVKFLLQNGADIRAKNKLGNNVVMIACINQRLEILRLLLNPLPKISSQNSRPKTLLVQQMQINGYQNMYTNNDDEEEEKEHQMRLFIKEIINDGNMKKMTSLHAACLSGNVQIVKLLLENGADLFKWDHVS